MGLLRSEVSVVSCYFVSFLRRVAFTEGYRSVGAVFAQYVVRHIYEAQLMHVTAVIQHDAFQRVNAGVEWRHPVAHVIDARMRSGNLDVLFSAAGRARRAYILVGVASGGDDR